MSEKEYPFLNAVTSKIKKCTTTIIKTFIGDMQDEEKVRSLVFEKDFDNRDSFDLITQYNMTEILNNKNIEKVALELWDSEYDIKGTILECSSAYIIVNYNTFNKPLDLVENYMFYNLTHRQIHKLSHHMFQFQVWMKSMKAKFMTEAFFLFILTVIFQYFLLQALSSGDTLLTAYQTATSTYSSQADIDSALENHYSKAIQYYDYMKITVLLSIVAFFYPMRIILEMAFATKTKRSLNFFTFTNFL